jgi:hypothetical protein
MGWMVLSFSLIDRMDGFFPIFIHPFIGWMLFYFHSFIGWMDFSFFILPWDGWIFNFSFIHGMDGVFIFIQSFTD